MPNKNLVMQSYEYSITSTIVSNPDNGVSSANYKQPNSSFNFSIDPNPVHDNVSIIYRSTTDGTLHIYDCWVRKTKVNHKTWRN